MFDVAKALHRLMRGRGSNTVVSELSRIEHATFDAAIVHLATNRAISAAAYACSTLQQHSQQLENMAHLLEARPLLARPLPMIRSAVLPRGRPLSRVVRAVESTNEASSKATEPTIFYGGKSFTETEVSQLQSPACRLSCSLGAVVPRF